MNNKRFLFIISTLLKVIRQFEWHFSTFFRRYELTYEKSVALRITFTSQKKSYINAFLIQFDRNENLNLTSDFTANKWIETFQVLLKVTLLTFFNNRVFIGSAYVSFLSSHTVHPILLKSQRTQNILHYYCVAIISPFVQKC